jgi:L-ascorbate metabolism protein UlaG (beta-lactamase superfamily)
MPKNTELSVKSREGATADFSQGSVFFVGTATVILRYAGFTILTDPNFLHAGDHVHSRLRADRRAPHQPGNGA